jgi:hypothetical protein
MKHLMIVALLGACMTPVTSSSRTFLSVYESRAVVNEDPHAASVDMIAMLGERHYNLVDQRSTNDALVLTFRGDRTIVTEGGRQGVSSTNIGSEFTATLQAMPGGVTQVELYGRPLIDSANPKLGPFQDADHLHVTGAEEAEVVHGVLSELAVTRKIVPAPRPATTPPVAPAVARSGSQHDQCVAERHAAYERARTISDPAARAKVYESAPSCDATP